MEVENLYFYFFVGSTALGALVGAVTNVEPSCNGLRPDFGSIAYGAIVGTVLSHLTIPFVIVYALIRYHPAATGG